MDRHDLVVLGGGAAGISRAVLQRATCPVLVVRGRPREARSLVVGLDGSVNAKRATRSSPASSRRRGARVTLVRVVEPMTVLSASRLPRGVRGTLRHEMMAQNARQLDRARRDVDVAVRRLRRSGWIVRNDPHRRPAP